MECGREYHPGLHWSRGSSYSVHCGRSADGEPLGSSQGGDGGAVEDGGGSRGVGLHLADGGGAGVAGGEVDGLPTEAEGNPGLAAAWQLKQ